MTLEHAVTMAVGGGKGGIGKSFVATSLACHLALSGHQVILVDADLAGADIHTMFGHRVPEHTLGEFLDKEADSLEEILLPTVVPSLRLICGASEFLEIANPHYAKKAKLLRAITKLKTDFVIIDIGAGASLNNLDFFNLADMGILVTTPLPTAIQNAYGFLKVAVHRLLTRHFPASSTARALVSDAIARDGAKTTAGLLKRLEQHNEAAASEAARMLENRKYSLIVNMATAFEGEKLAKAIRTVSWNYLGVGVLHSGSIPRDEDVEKSIREMTPLLLSRTSESGTALAGITERLLEELATQREEARERVPRASAPALEEGETDVHRGALLCLNDEVEFEGRTVHLQTEDLGPTRAEILSLVFRGGRILFTRATPYSELPDSANADVIREKVRWQHTAVKTGIRAGKLRDRILE